jgi:hypothetical protein
MLKLLQTINKVLPSPLALEDIVDSLEHRWPELDAAITRALESGAVSKPVKRDSDDVLNEILTIVREMQRASDNLDIVDRAVRNFRNPAMVTVSYVMVHGRDGNRRDGSLLCGLCGTGTDIHFYEGDGVPKLGEALMTHYNRRSCKDMPADAMTNLRVEFENGAEPQSFLYDVRSRTLRELAT